MAKDYSEDLLIQKSTAELLEKELGWHSVYAYDNVCMSWSWFFSSMKTRGSPFT